MLPDLDPDAIYALQNGKNGGYLKYYREDSDAYFGDKPDGVNLIITEPEQGKRVINYGIVLELPDVGDNKVFNLKTYDGRYIMAQRDANGSDVVALENMGDDQRAQWTLKHGNFRTDDEFCLLRNVDDTQLCLYCTSQNTLWLWGDGNLPASRAKPAQHWRFVYNDTQFPSGILGTKSPVVTTDMMYDRYQNLRSNQTQFIRRTKEEEEGEEEGEEEEEEEEEGDDDEEEEEDDE